MKRSDGALALTPASHGTVKTITIPEILKASGRDRISLLKIDRRSGDGALQCSSADTNWLDRTDNIVIELHGAEAEKAFHNKIDKSRFALSRCDELTVCLSLP